MTGRLAEVALQTFVAGVGVEVLLRQWRASDPALKLRMRLLVLLVPLLLHPTFHLLAPFRSDAGFVDRWSLFSFQHWRAVELWGVAADALWLIGCAVVGVALLLVDLVPWIQRRTVGRGRAFVTAPAPVALRVLVLRLSDRMVLTPPEVVFLDSPAVLLSCRGVQRPSLVVSRGALEALDAEELEAAVAHELAHLARRDVLTSWLLFAARVLQPFNPMVHVVARALARDLERRADLHAAGVTGHPLALASGLIKVLRASRPPRERVGRMKALFERARVREVEARCRRLLRPPAAEAQRWARLRVGATAVGLGALLFLVT